MRVEITGFGAAFRITTRLCDVARAVKPEAMCPKRGAARALQINQNPRASARAKREREDRAPEPVSGEERSVYPAVERQRAEASVCAHENFN